MIYRSEDAIAVLERTPRVLRAMLAGLPAAWTEPHEGPGTWSAFDIVGHLIHGERADWITRTEHILRDGDSTPFAPFDREAMFVESRDHTLAELLDTFETLRARNLVRLDALGLTGADLDRPGLHPALGAVTLRQLLATWVAHDLGHIAQIARVMARQYTDEVGPWRAYLPVLGSPSAAATSFRAAP